MIISVDQQVHNYGRLIFRIKRIIPPFNQEGSYFLAEINRMTAKTGTAIYLDFKYLGTNLVYFRGSRNELNDEFLLIFLNKAFALPMRAPTLDSVNRGWFLTKLAPF